MAVIYLKIHKRNYTYLFTISFIFLSMHHQFVKKIHITMQ